MVDDVPPPVQHKLDHTHPFTRETRELVITSIALTVLTTAFTLARIIAKRMRHLKWAWDDSLLMVALFCQYMGATGCIIAVTAGHIGRHIETASASELADTLLLLWAMQFPLIIGLTATRYSITILFLRLFFTKMYTKLRLAAYVCIAFTTAWFFISFVLIMSHCRPLKHNWMLPIEDPEYCFPMKPYQIYMISSGLVLDAIIWSLPHHVVWQLQLRRAHKIAITSMFALGIFNILMAICRLIFMNKLQFFGDLTHALPPHLIWGISQISTALILTCCPLLRPLFEKLVPKKLTRIATARQKSEPITIVTNIAVHRDTSDLPHQAASPDPFLGPSGPVVVVEPPTQTRRRKSWPNQLFEWCIV